MNDKLPPELHAEVPWPTHGQPMPVPNTSMLPDRKRPPEPAPAPVAQPEPEPVGGWRAAVGRHPLFSLGVALALGAVVARLSPWGWGAR